MSFTDEKKLEIITNYIKAVYYMLKFEKGVENVFGDMWQEQTETGGAFMDMTYHYDNILFSLLDDTYCDVEWLIDIVYKWAKEEIEGKKHLPRCYDSEAGFPTCRVDTIEELAQYIVDTPLLVFEGEIDVADEDY